MKLTVSRRYNVIYARSSVLRPAKAAVANTIALLSCYDYSLISVLGGVHFDVYFLCDTYFGKDISCSWDRGCVKNAEKSNVKVKLCYVRLFLLLLHYYLVVRTFWLSISTWQRLGLMMYFSFRDMIQFSSNFVIVTFITINQNVFIQCNYCY